MKWAALALVTPLLMGAAPKRPVEHRAPLPMLPSVARVQLDVRDDSVIVEHRILLPEGDWHTGDLDFCAEFGAPSIPAAVDGKLFPIADGALDADSRTPSESVAVEFVPRCPASAHPLLGPPKMAGALLHLKKDALARALSPGKMAELRIRSKVPLPRANEEGVRDVVVRLGVHEGAPLTLGMIGIESLVQARVITSAEARLCGADADRYPLAIQYRDRSPKLLVDGSLPVAPVLAVRHANDDLCVRFTLGEVRK